MQDTRHNLNYSYTVKDDAYARPAWARPEPESLHDVPISNFGFVDNLSHHSGLHNGGSSLPSADELRRMERPRPRQSMPWAKWAFSTMVAFACLLWIVIGVSRRGGDDGGDDKSPADAAKTLTGVAAGTFERSASDVIAYLVQNKVSIPETLQDIDSPQYQAVQWLVNSDGNPWTLPLVPLAQREGYKFVSRYVLAVLYFALGGDDWKYDLEFLSDDDICEWNVVVLDPHTGVFSSPMGVMCDRLNLFPTSLYMTNNFQVGSLPTEIGTLFTLREIDMERNTLKGSIPSEFCQLDQLHRVMLGKNSLTGTIPSCISNLDGLQSLALNDNEFKGTLPSSFANLDLLKILFLDDNLLSGYPLPIFNQLTDLEFFMAQNNKFMGILDEHSFKNSAKLAWLDLSGNEFLSTGDVAFPAHLLSLPELEVIDLSSNFLTGPLPTNVPLNERLKFLGLHNNDIVGSIPASITNLFALHHLDLSKNQLTGTVDVLGSLKWLRALYLGENSKLAAASIPTMFLDFFYLQDLSLRNTNRVGAVPEFLADLRTLKLLDLGTNDMQGEIPSVLGQLSNLEFLMLNGNPRLTGLLPSTFGALQEMRALFIDGTGIAGNVEEVVCALPSFAVVDGREIAYANCINGLFTCKCCTCCDPTLPDCTSVPFQLNLRESWTKDFAKLNFQFTNETSFLERGEINAEAYSKQDDSSGGGNN